MTSNDGYRIKVTQYLISRVKNQYLRTVGVGTSVSHREDTRSSVLELEVLVLNNFSTEFFLRSYLEFVSVDRFATSTVVVGEITALKNESASIILDKCLPGTRTGG